MIAGDEIPFADFIAGFAPAMQARLREDILAGRKRRVVARGGGVGEPWAIYELDPERNVARVVRVGE